MTLPEARLDFETRSDVDLRTRGAGPYFASPHWRALILAYRIEDGELQTWTHGQPCPADLRAHIEAGGYIRAFNASFERQCLNQLAARHGWPRPAIDRYRCTAAEAAAMSLPRSLEGVGEALGLEIQKDKRGRALIQKFSMPRRARKGEDPAVLHWNEPEDFPDDFAEFVAYCRRDVEVEEAVSKRVVPLSDYEQRVYTLDQIINDRGIRIDVTSARSAIRLAEKAKAALNRKMSIATGGYVPTCTQPAKLVEWVQSQGVEIPSAAKADITDLLEDDDLLPNVREALEIRQEAAKTSVSKLSSMLARAGADGRVRGSFLYHGASTGRWTSNGVNFANMPRPRKIYEKAVETGLRTDALFANFRREDPGLLELLYGADLGRPLHLVSDAIRGFVWAAPGHEFVQADYSGIEGAVIAWSSGEEWKLAEMRAILADPEHPDLYRQTAASILGLPIAEVHKKHWARQAVGKPAELGLGYQGGVKAFWTFARNYGVNLRSVLPVLDTADGEVRERAEKRFEGCFKRGLSLARDLPRDQWVACEIIKVGWRAANSAIAAGWKAREAAVRAAIAEPGAITETRKVRYVVRNGFLWTLLPSGRCLAYAAPKLIDQVWVKIRLDDGSWSDSETMDRAEAEAKERRGEVKIEGATSPRISVLGVDGTTKKWRRYGLYGGLLAENDTQAIARDLLVNGLFKAEAAGYPVVAHVYDEIIAEVPRGFGSVRDFERLICELPPWAEGLPLSAGGWRGKRYRKD